MEHLLKMDLEFLKNHIPLTALVNTKKLLWYVNLIILTAFCLATYQKIEKENNTTYNKNMSHVNTVQYKTQNPLSISIHFLQLSIGHRTLLTEKY